MKPHARRLALVVSAAAMLGACAELRDMMRESQRPEVVAEGAGMAEAAGKPATAGDQPIAAEAPREADVSEIIRGTGKFIDRKAAARSAVAVTPTGDITLNFADADIREVVRSVLGDTLGANYVLSPKVQGKVTAHTSRPLPRSALLATLENILRLHGAVLVEADGVYKVLPASEATSGAIRPRLGKGARGRGFGVQIVPLEFIAVAEMEKILQPFTTTGSILRVDKARNLLLLSGTRQELGNLLDIVGIFDVDWLAGTSVALVQLKYTEAKDVIEDLEKVFGNQSDGPMAGLVRFQPIERLNAVLVMSARPAYLKKVQEWITRFDRTSDEAGRRLFVYFVENGRAVDLAATLGQIFGTAAAPAPARAALAPGLKPVEVRTEKTVVRTTAKPGEKPPATGQPRPMGAKKTPAPKGAKAAAISIEGESEIRIIADEANNALVILATPADYRMVEAAIKKLDIVPLQVLIEATIAEVTLNDQLKYGIEWFFRTGSSSFALTEGAGDDTTPDQILPNFSFLFNTPSARVVLNALDKVSDVNIISSPQLMVLDNQTARLQVGLQVPFATQSSVSVGDPDAPLVSTIQQLDTGVILNVTPRVNPGGLVIMEIEQEVSFVKDPGTGGVTPTIDQSKISTTVAVQSGETVALGGLIQDTRTKITQGIPLLSRLPIIGPLFGVKEDNTDRTELLVLITPHVVRNMEEARRVTEELRRRVRAVRPLGERIR
ncbi:MAG: type II secretion system protein GspD [Alphaproteobacteria bacterium]|nr:MAG: type II secretion system protein GspD [Alphaproteobacteria bacterium]